MTNKPEGQEPVDACAAFMQELENLLYRFTREFDITLAEILGSLEVAKAEILMSAPRAFGAKREELRKKEEEQNKEKGEDPNE